MERPPLLWPAGTARTRTSHPVPAVQKILAYKIQADRFGDLDADTLKVLDRAGGSDGQPSIISKKLTALDQRRFRRRRGLSWSVNGTENLTGSW